MKIYTHIGKGHYIGSTISVLAKSKKMATYMIRNELDSVGLHNECVDIVEVSNIKIPKVIISINGDY